MTLHDSQTISSLTETLQRLKEIAHRQPTEFYIVVRPEIFVAGMLWQTEQNNLGAYLHWIDTEPADEDTFYPLYPDARDRQWLKENGYTKILETL